MSEFVLILIVSMILGMMISYSIEIYSPIKVAFLVVLIIIVLHMLLPTFENEKFVGNFINTNECNFSDRISDADLRIMKDKSSLTGCSKKYHIRSYTGYPELSKKQINYNDCTNYESGENSCLIPNPKRDLNKIIPDTSILISGIANNKDISQVFREDLNYYKDFVF